MRFRCVKILSFIAVFFLISGFAFLGSKTLEAEAAPQVFAEWDLNGDKEIRAGLNEINVADASVMQINEKVKVFGNIVSFGPSIGEFAYYSTKAKYQNVRIQTELCFGSTMPDWQRVVLRGDEISTRKTGGVNGYFISLEKSGYNLYRQVEGSYILLQYGAWSKNDLGSANLYDDNYHKFIFEIFDRADGSVVINMAVNDKPILHIVDSASRETDFFGQTISEKNRVSYAGSGYVGFYMNSTNSPWYLKGEFTNGLFSPNVYAGDENIYMPSSTADIQHEKINFENDEFAVLQEEYSNLALEFEYEAKIAGADNKILAVSAFNTRMGASDYSSLDGITATLYSDKLIFRLNGSEIKTVDGLNLCGRKVKLQILTTCVSGEFLFCVGVDGEWYIYNGRDIKNTIGYFGIYSFTTVSATSKAYPDRNYRVLLIGNSITNHSPLASLNYGIGSTGGETWGMATSSPETDYSHRVVSAIRELDGYENTEFMAVNMASWEADITSFEYVNTYQSAADFEADMIIVKLGENAATHSPDYTTYAAMLEKLINFLKTNENAKVIITTEYWGSESYAYDLQVDMGNIMVARNNGYSLVRINDLGTVYANKNNASADGEHYRNLEGNAPSGKSWYDEWSGWTSGVKQHPGMVGHENIGARIAEAAVRLLTGGEDVVQYKQLTDGIWAEYNTSNLYGNVAGAYDYKGNTNVSASEITGDVNEKFAENYYLFKGLDLVHDGDIYRIEIAAEDDTTAGYNYKAYTLKNGKLTELPVYINSDVYRDGFISVTGEIGDKLYICVEYNPDKIFADNTLFDAKYGSILKFINRNNDNFVLDLSAKNAKSLTVNNLCYPVLISSGKDIEIKLADGKFIIERRTFETIAKTTNNLFFSIQKLSAINYLRNATTVVSSFSESDGLYPIHTDDNGYLTDIYEVQISYNGRSGNALYVNKGISAQIYGEIEKENCLQIVSAVLPALGSSCKNIEMMSKDKFGYNNGVISIDVSDFDSDVILCYKPIAEELILEGYRKDYTQGDSLDLDSFKLKFRRDDGTIEEIKVTSDMVTGFDTKKAGSYTLTISYSGKTVTCQINVAEKEKKGCRGSAEGGSVALLLICSALLVLRYGKKTA